MDLDHIRTRLAGLEGRAYWRSLDELADTPEFHEYVDREFPSQASEFNDPAGRRTFLKLMGASLALAGVGACTRQPEEKIVPYVRQPEEIIPGRPLFYATAMVQGGFAEPLLAENHMGRPTKLEGNPEHPASLGSTNLFSQASVLTLYDPDRSRTVIGGAEDRSWVAFQVALASRNHFAPGHRWPGPADSDRADHVAVAARSAAVAPRQDAGSQVASVGCGLRCASGRGPRQPSGLPARQGRCRRVARRGLPRIRPGDGALHQGFRIAPADGHAHRGDEPALRRGADPVSDRWQGRSPAARSRPATFTASRPVSPQRSAPARRLAPRRPTRRADGSPRSRPICRRTRAARRSSPAIVSRRRCMPSRGR